MVTVVDVNSDVAVASLPHQSSPLPLADSGFRNGFIYLLKIQGSTRKNVHLL
jgi:hypothetical protein